jgi:2-amino-4-hydroxy-6-hydroxymethyldihydropteridine diphosphokinase
MEGGVVLSLGSNGSDREACLSRGLALLLASHGMGGILKVSSLYRTEPVGLRGAPEFINMAADVRTNLDPEQLLTLCMNVEGCLGRNRGLSAPIRPIDIDIVLFRARVVSRPDLVIPHPRMHARRFVLVPVHEISAASVHPVFGVTVKTLLQRCPDRHDVNKIETAARLPHLHGPKDRRRPTTGRA